MPTKFARTFRWLVATCVLLVGAVACGDSAAGNSLKPLVGETTVGTGVSSHVGEVWDFGQVLANISGVGVRLDRVEVLGLPKGLTVAGAVAYRAEDTNGVVGLLKGDLATVQPDLYGHPSAIKGLLVPAGSEDWYVVVEVSPSAPGTYRTKGLRIWYVVNGKRQHQDFAVRFKTKTV
jgi:hypothetical protein